MNKLLAGGAALQRIAEQSPEERKATDHQLWQARVRDYKAWIAKLPISEADRELLQIVDRVRQRLISGAGIPAKTGDALRAWSSKDRSEGKKFVIRSGVVAVHKIQKLPLTETTTGPGAFEVAGKLFAEDPDRPLSASQVRKIYYAKKFPKKKKTRPSP